MCNNDSCDFCKEAFKDIQAYRNGYGKTFPPNVIEEINKLRQDLCNKMHECTRGDCCAKELINTLDTDPDIKRKKWLTD